MAACKPELHVIWVWDNVFERFQQLFQHCRGCSRQHNRHNRNTDFFRHIQDVDQKPEVHVSSIDILIFPLLLNLPQGLTTFHATVHQQGIRFSLLGFL